MGFHYRPGKALRHPKTDLVSPRPTFPLTASFFFPPSTGDLLVVACLAAVPIGIPRFYRRLDFCNSQGRL
jgi:hypothetical protein